MGLEFWRTTAVLVAAIGQTAFVIFYATLPWWRTFLGRALFIKALTLFLLTNTIVVGRSIDWPHEETTFIVVYGLTAVGIWGQFIAFVHQKYIAEETPEELAR